MLCPGKYFYFPLLVKIMSQKYAYIDSKLKINFCKRTIGQNIFIRTLGRINSPPPPPQLIKRNLFRIMYQEIRIPMNKTFMPSETESEAAPGTWEHTFFNLYSLMIRLDILWNCFKDWRISSPRNSHCWSSACLWANNFMDLSVTVSMGSPTYDSPRQRNEAMC